jgi:single-strand DNA-binding protein
MAGSLNKVTLIGRLGANPEVRDTANGTPVTSFSIATSESWNDKQGQRQERTEWHRIVAWAKLAELCGEHLSKGRQVCVEGRLQTRQWNDRDGNKRHTTEVHAREIVFLGSRPGDQASTRASNSDDPGCDSGQPPKDEDASSAVGA